MQFKKIAFFTILSLILFSGCGSDDTKKEKLVEIENKKDFKLTTTEAQTLNIKKTENGFIFEEFKDKAILVNFFATWCPPCKAEIPHLNNLREKYKDKFEIIAVLMEENKDNTELKNFINEYKINYVVTNSKQNYEFANIIGEVKAIPTMFLYNKNGEVIQKYVGIVPEEMMEIDIKKAIK